MKNIQALLVFSFTLLSISGFTQAQSSTDSLVNVDGLTPMPISTIEKNRGIVSKNKINVNFQTSLKGSSVQADASSKIEEAFPAAEEGFLIQLPGGMVVTLVTNRSQSYVDGVETYSGRVEDTKSGYFTLSVKNGKVFGQVNIGPMIYNISYDKTSRSHVLTEIDQARMPHNTPEPLGDGLAYKAALKSKGMTTKSQGLPTPMMLTSPDIGTIRVLILYASDVAYPSYLASNVISSMNNTFFGDGMDPDLHFTLADLRNLNNDLDGLCSDEILADMESTTAPFANISTWIDDEYADVVLTISKTDPSLTCLYTGAWGRVGGQASDLLNSSKPFATVADTYAIGDLTAVHEIGHVLGGGHPTWSVAKLEVYSDDVEPYSRGYIAANGDWQTVMGSYDDNGCDFSTTLPNNDCVRLPLWSNPSKSYDSETRGVTYTSDVQVPYSSNMASALEIQMPIAAEFQSYPYAAPGIPSNIDVEECFNKNFLSWDATTHAEHYQMLFSYSSSFTNPKVVYFGTSTAKYVVVPQHSTKYVKIRACNGNGCGAYSSQLTLTYNNYCN